MFDWMAWTLPVAVFFTCIVLMLIGMTVWEIKSPTTMRKGFLPLETTRGDRRGPRHPLEHGNSLLRRDPSRNLSRCSAARTR